MRGLRTQESDSFIRFFEIVQNSANELKKVFFLDCEEGKDGSINGIAACNLSGWLLPESRAEEFESVWKMHREDDEWADFFVFARWEDDNGVKIVFK